LAVKTPDVATPEVLVTAVFPPVNVPLAPLAGALNVTVTPFAGFPPEVTVTTNGFAKAVPTVAFCGVPLVTMTL
jgi:hypothetical protein